MLGLNCSCIILSPFLQVNIWILQCQFSNISFFYFYYYFEISSLVFDASFLCKNIWFLFYVRKNEVNLNLFVLNAIWISGPERATKETIWTGAAIKADARSHCWGYRSRIRFWFFRFIGDEQGLKCWLNLYCCSGDATDVVNVAASYLLVPGYSLSSAISMPKIFFFSFGCFFFLELDRTLSECLLWHGCFIDYVLLWIMAGC